jgi:hypothetical protein
MLSLVSLSKYQFAVAEDPAVEAFMLSDCVPQVAHRSVVSESSCAPPLTDPHIPPCDPVSHHDSGVGNVDLVKITVSPTLNAALHAVETVIVGAV